MAEAGTHIKYGIGIKYTYVSNVLRQTCLKSLKSSSHKQLFSILFQHFHSWEWWHHPNYVYMCTLLSNLHTKTKTKPCPTSASVYTQRARWKSAFKAQEQESSGLQQWVSSGHCARVSCSCVYMLKKARFSFIAQRNREDKHGDDGDQTRHSYGEVTT